MCICVCGRGRLGIYACVCVCVGVCVCVCVLALRVKSMTHHINTKQHSPGVNTMIGQMTNTNHTNESSLVNNKIDISENVSVSDDCQHCVHACLFSETKPCVMSTNMQLVLVLVGTDEMQASLLWRMSAILRLHCTTQLNDMSTCQPSVGEL